MKNKSLENILKDIREQEILESIGDAVSIQDTNFKIIFQNKTSKEIMGAHVGKYCYEAYALRDKTCKDCPLAPVFAGGKTHTVERSKPSNKGTIYLEITASPLRNSSGEIIAGVEVMRDITERKMTEKALIQSEEKYRLFVQHADEIIYAIKIKDDPFKGRVHFMSDQIKSILGYEPYDFISNPQLWFSIVHPDDVSTLTDTTDKILREGKKTLRIYRLRHKVTDEYCWLEDNVVPQIESSGKVEGFFGVARDITKRKQAEESLKESEQRFRQLIDTTFDGIAMTENAVILEVNPLLVDLIGYNYSELIGMHISKLISSESFDLVRQNLNSDYGKPYEIVCVKKDGKTFPVEVCGKTVNHNGRKVRMTAIKDISERKRLEEEFMKIQKLESLGILAGGIAHDFNNFLTAILGNIYLAKMHTVPDDKIYKLLAESEKATMRAKDLTQQLLTFSKGGEPVKKTVSLKGLIHDTSCFALRGSKTKCECLLPDNLWPVEIDEGQIIQVFHNLILNSDHAMPEGGVINIDAENITSTDDKKGLLPGPGKYVKISVHDNGIGIPDDHLQKIFDPYFTTKQKGSGLGLTTSFSIIRKHGGAITVESKPGKGTAFYIYLPASSKTNITHKEITAAVPSGKGKILVMDDDDMVRNVISEMLRSAGYKAELTKDGAEAIELYQKARKSRESFDVVILDLTVPGGMGGKEAIKKLLFIDPEVKAIVSSGYSNDSVMSNFKDYGFSAVISKPFKAADISEILNELINS